MTDQSSNCMQNDHDICTGIIKEISENGIRVTKMCECPCHDNFYKLVKKSQNPMLFNNNPFDSIYS